MKLKVAFAAEDRLGEGPVWSVDEQALYWVDIERPCLQRYHPETGAYTAWTMPSQIGSFALRQGGGAVVALRDGLYTFDLGSGHLTNICRPEPKRGTRFNDGKCDRYGRFWAGTMDLKFAAPVGALYRLDGDGNCDMMRPHVTCSNGLGWSPDNRTMYYTDTPTRHILAYDFDGEIGKISHERIFTHDAEGYPDGLTVDAAGYVWSAKWDGWKIVRYTPDGTVDREIPLPVQRPTSCTFGGPALNQLYITSASVGLSPAERAEQPLAGSLLVLETDIAGLPDALYAG
jgi:sugar lactone lactonase YvrE